jgi:hypothetical protein
MQKTAVTPASFLESLPAPVRDDMIALHREISKVMKGHPETVWKGKMWGGTDQTIIGYGDVKYERPGKTVEWFFIGLALQKNHISLYVNAVADNKYLGQSYAKKLGKVKLGSASIGFRSLADINLSALREMLAQARKLMPGGGTR